MSVTVFALTFGFALLWVRALGRRTRRSADERARRSAARITAALALWPRSLFPLYWMLVASLTPERALFERRRAAPAQLSLEHYRALFDERDFLDADPQLARRRRRDDGLCAMPLAAPCAYALARLRFRGRALAARRSCSRCPCFRRSRLSPPLYLILRELRLIDTYPGLVLPYLTFATPLAVWLLTGFFRQLPRDLEDAAMIDGAQPVARAVGDRAAAGGARNRHHRHPDLPLLLERVPVRAVVHARTRSPHRPGRDRAVSRAVSDPVGPGLAATVVATLPVARAGRWPSSAASSPG